MRKTTLHLFMLLLLVLVACKNDKNDSAQKSPLSVSDETPAPGNAPVIYFPDFAIKSQKTTLEDFEVRWYAKHLKALQEPSLLATASDSVERYRFLFIPSFSFPLSIRIEKHKNDSTFTLYARSVEYAKVPATGSYEPGALKMSLMKKYSKFYFRQWKELQESLARVNFHQSATMLPRVDMKGNIFIVEGVKDGKYSMMAKTAPQDDAFVAGREFIELCDFFSSMATVDKDEISF